MDKVVIIVFKKHQLLYYFYIMKKLLSLFLVGFLLVGCSQKKEKQTDLQKSKLKGKVKSVIWSNYNADNKFGEVKKGLLNKKTIYKYDESGNKTEHAEYGSDGSLNWKYTWRHECKFEYYN